MDNSQIIAELKAEITELKKRMSALEEKFNNREEVQKQAACKSSPFCSLQPNISSHHENACQNVDPCPLPYPPDSPTASPVCDSVCTHTEQSTSVLYPKISSVCTVLKKEPDSMEINKISSFGGVADHLAFPEWKEANFGIPVTKQEVPLGSVCQKGLQTPLKKCSVQLVDCGNKFKQVTKRAKASIKWKRRRSSRVKIIRLGKRLKHPLDCSLCGKTISAATSLTTPRTRHVRKGEYACSQCGRKFHYLHTYVKHKKLHGRKHLQHLNVEKNTDIDMKARQLVVEKSIFATMSPESA